MYVVLSQFNEFELVWSFELFPWIFLTFFLVLVKQCKLYYSLKFLKL